MFYLHCVQKKIKRSGSPTDSRPVSTWAYTELLIGRVALTSFNWRTYWVVRVGAYSLNNLRLG